MFPCSKLFWRLLNLQTTKIVVYRPFVLGFRPLSWLPWRSRPLQVKATMDGREGRMYACMHACRHACMYICMYMYVCMCECVCMFACMHASMHACVQISISVYRALLVPSRYLFPRNYCTQEPTGIRTLTPKPKTIRPPEVRQLEHDRPPTPNQRKKENQHNSSYIQVPFLALYCTAAQKTKQNNPINHNFWNPPLYWAF